MSHNPEKIAVKSCGYNCDNNIWWLNVTVIYLSLIVSYTEQYKFGFPWV